MTPSLRIQLLGDFRLEYDGTPVPGVDTTRLQSFLAYLLFHRNAPQSRSHLAFLFWPDSTESQARTNLRKLIYHLRQALPEADRFLRADTKVVQWLPDSAFTLDIADFEAAHDQAAEAGRAGDPEANQAALERAVAAYGGDLLPSCYHDWVFSEQERLRQKFIEGQRRLIQLYEDQRDYPAAIKCAQRLLRYDPLDEDAARHLMQLQAQDGQRAQALRTYHTCATALERELGVVPSAATKDVYERLQRMDGALSGAPERAPVAALPVADWPLVGRKGEWRQLQAAWDQAKSGTSQLVVLSGEAGIGKTRLAEELVFWAGRQGTATASARCYASEGGLAYAPVTAWLRSDALQSGMVDLDPVWLSEIARLLPELRFDRSEIPAPSPLNERWQRQRLFDALARAFYQRRQLVLLVDDLQWGDRETLECLSYLLHFHGQWERSGGGRTRLLIVATVRNEEMVIHGGLGSLLEDLRRSRQLHEIELGPLGWDEVQALAARVAASELGRELDHDLADRLFEETEGNPLFVVETVRAGPSALEAGLEEKGGTWPLPPAVQEAIAARLDRLSPKARELVGVAAVVGREFTFDVLTEASANGANGASGDAIGNTTNPELLVGALDELWQRRIIRELDASAYDFGHDKIREVAYAELSTVRRRFLHQRVAQALETVHEKELAVASRQIAVHYERGGQPDKAIPYYRKAAAVAREIYANDEAIDHYRHLLQGQLASRLTPEELCAIWVDLGRTLQLTGEWARAEAIYRQALANAQSGEDLAGRARCQRALADVVRLRGNYDEALKWLVQAQDDYGNAGDLKGVIDVLWTMGEVYWYKGDHAQALNTLELQMQISTDIGDRRSMSDAAGSMGIVYWSQGDFEHAVASCQQSIDIALEIGHQWAVGRAAITLGNVYRSQGDPAQAMGWYRQAFEVASRIGDRQCVGWAVANMGGLYEMRGEIERALRCDAYALQNALEIGDRWSVSIFLASRGEHHVAQGRPEQADAFFQKAITLGRALKLNYLNSYLWFLADSYARQGRYQEAKALNGEALILSIQSGEGRMGGEDILAKAHILSVKLRLALGETDLTAAVTELEQMLEAATNARQQARLCYEIWRLDPDQETYRQSAAQGYLALYTDLPNHEYTRRYRELTGQSLAVPTPLNDVPLLVKDSQPDMDVMLAQVDEILAELPLAEPVP